MKETLIIVNPAAAGGRTGRRWPEVAARLRAAGLDFDAALTSSGGEAEQLSRQALREGRALVVAAGDLGAWENVRGLRRIRQGTHLDAGNPKLSHALAERVEISSAEPTRVDADGEQPGVLPAVIEVQSGALHVVCP